MKEQHEIFLDIGIVLHGTRLCPRSGALDARLLCLVPIEPVVWFLCIKLLLLLLVLALRSEIDQSVRRLR